MLPQHVFVCILEKTNKKHVFEKTKKLYTFKTQIKFFSIDWEWASNAHYSGIRACMLSFTQQCQPT